MDLVEYSQYDGLGLAELVEKKEVTSKELAQLMFKGIQKINPKINAVIEVFQDRIENGDPEVNHNGPFGGVPFMLKDIGACEAGRKQEMGSRLMKGNVAERNTYLTDLFKQAGLVNLGRTTTPEFGFAATTESMLTGKTRNPWNTNYITGGSSGGPSAGVAAGIIPLAHANDGGGSIRIPAGFCGLVGLKPSRGRVTRGPLVDESLFGFACELVVSRSVRDTAAILDATCKPCPGDPFIIKQPERSYLQEMSAPTGQLKIGFTTENWRTGDRVEAEVAGIIEKVARQCEAMGHIVEEKQPVFDRDALFSTLDIAFSFGTLAFDDLAKKMGRVIDSNYLETAVVDTYHKMKQQSAHDLFLRLQQFNPVRRQLGAFFEAYDLLLTPTNAQAKVPFDTIDSNSFTSKEEFLYANDAVCPFPALSNLTGQPAISLPLGQTPDSFPIGAHFAARFGDETTLIRIASALEEAMPWVDRIPAVHVSVS